MTTNPKNSVVSMDSNGEKTIRSSVYPALTKFYRGGGYNYLPYVYCPNCGAAEDKELSKHHVYLCNKCGGEYYWSYYGKVMFIEKEFYDVFDVDDVEEMGDGVPPTKPL